MAACFLLVCAHPNSKSFFPSSRHFAGRRLSDECLSISLSLCYFAPGLTSQDEAVRTTARLFRSDFNVRPCAHPKVTFLPFFTICPPPILGPSFSSPNPPLYFLSLQKNFCYVSPGSAPFFLRHLQFSHLLELDTVNWWPTPADSSQLYPLGLWLSRRRRICPLQELMSPRLVGKSRHAPAPFALPFFPLTLVFLFRPFIDHCPVGPFFRTYGCCPIESISDVQLSLERRLSAPPKSFPFFDNFLLPGAPAESCLFRSFCAF